MNINALAITDGADTFALAACPTVHTRGYLQSTRIKMVLGVKHLSLFIGRNMALTGQRTASCQPQSRINDMQVII